MPTPTKRIRVEYADGTEEFFRAETWVFDGAFVNFYDPDSTEMGAIGSVRGADIRSINHVFYNSRTQEWRHRYVYTQGGQHGDPAESTEG